jgi:predicted lipid-binding transport protein (Tim44 family)
VPQETDGSAVILLLFLAWGSWHVWRWLSPPADRSLPKKKADPALAGGARLLPVTPRPAARSESGLTPRGRVTGGDGGLAETVAEIRRFDHGFRLASFLDGSAGTYEAVAHAFSVGDRTLLEGYLSPEVYAVFDAEIAAREAREERAVTLFVRIAEPELIDATVHAERIEISVRFRAEIVGATWDAGGEVVAGDEKRSRATDEIWTFARSTSERHGAWMVVAAGPA